MKYVLVMYAVGGVVTVEEGMLFSSYEKRDMPSRYAITFCSHVCMMHDLTVEPLFSQLDVQTYCRIYVLLCLQFYIVSFHQSPSFNFLLAAVS